ncbi:rho GTPase-activating protein 11B-like [Notechis scutatus]|uniref:Rho GTPase-activating protein 11B-like n=1 Tax=Notechis scutatus TaxID=8663 RepID=A0A6J1VM72_9SAUR|nr:rho GTPase-activating protein 11B-like [Notechis scutatus]
MSSSENKPSKFSQAIISFLASSGIGVSPSKTSPRQKAPTGRFPTSGLFGIPLPSLRPSQHVEGVPEFLVDACEHLRPHLHLEGLFRKCGSMTRIKALKARLEAGERCLHMALPCDVATLVKQFLRSLPEPLIPAELQGPLCQVQQRSREDRESLTLLITCLLPPWNSSILRYFLSFLQEVAAR